MGCIFAAFTFLFPRLGFLMVWIARPSQVNAAFDTFIIPFFGVFLLPFTTLMYVILYRPGGLDGTDWLWIAIAVVFDIFNLGGSYVQGEREYHADPRIIRG